MRNKTVFFQLLGHIVGAITECSEVITKVHSHNYPGALLNAMQAAKHLHEVIAAHETLRAAGAQLLKHIRKLRSKMSSHPPQHQNKVIKRNDDDK